LATVVIELAKMGYYVGFGSSDLDGLDSGKDFANEARDLSGGFAARLAIRSDTGLGALRYYDDTDERNKDKQGDLHVDA